MSDIVIRFDLRLGASWKRGALAGLMMLSAVPELGSESVTLSTYYPAPSGVYTNMIATGNTQLARDGGVVNVANSYSNSTKLTVNGNTNVRGTMDVGGSIGTLGTVLTLNGNMSTSGNVTVGATGSGMFTTYGVGLDVRQNNTIRVGQAYLSSGGNYVHLANNEYFNGSAWVPTGGTGALLQIASQDMNLYTHDGGGGHAQIMNLNLTRADFSGHVIARGAGACNSGHIRAYATTGTTGCPGGTYATLQSGVISKYVMMPRYADIGTGLAQAWMLCCPCPVSGCPTML